MADFTFLHFLDLENNQVADISALEGIGVRIFDLSNNQISDISAMSSMSKLWRVYLSNNQIIDISPLENKLDDCEALDLSNNLISDVSALSTINNGFCRVDVSNNNIRDISCLDNATIRMVEYAGNPIGEPEEPQEPEQPEGDKPSDEEKPSEPAEPEKPSEEQKPSEPSKPVFTPDDFAELLKKQDIVIKPNDYVTITFAKGSKQNDTTGKTEYNFTTTVTTDFANAKLPAFITQNSFITKVSYTYSGVLPASAKIEISVGKDYAGKEVFYFLLNEDGTFDKNEVQKAKVNENGVITVTQEHCSDYVVTVKNPVDLYKEYEESQKPDNDNNTNNSGNGNENQGGQDNVNNSGTNNENQNEQDNAENNNSNKVETAPETGDNLPIGMLSIVLLLASALVVLGIKIYKRA